MSYHPLQDTYDEMQADSRTRPHWAAFLESFQGMGRETLQRRWAEVRRLIRENGVTFNVHGDPRGLERPWELDPLPVLVDESEWREVAAGLQQRARVLDLILEDVYGPQELIRNGLLPPELIHAHPSFLRACHGLPVPADCRLMLYATDMVRTPEGRFMVLRDRTQAPPGAGYALENRLVLTRLLPELFRECHAARLGPFFSGLRQSLCNLAAHNPNN
ncbi:MAG: circularly permuted type 2 ATP-grasp protein, partial [Candidatus Eremiobacterota bacterium]